MTFAYFGKAGLRVSRVVLATEFATGAAPNASLPVTINVARKVFPKSEVLSIVSHGSE
jgi:hypothetical protein